jgi:hypothetical protein
MSARSDMEGIVLRIAAKNRAVFVLVATIVQLELTMGGPITGAPGQPVDTGALRASYIAAFLDERTWQTSTNLPYARGIEDGVGPHGALTLRSNVGGFHSIKLIRVGFPAIVSYAMREAA